MSRTRSIGPTSAACAAALLFLGGMTHGARAQGISVVVNDKPVAFTGTPPREINGAVLVPLRGVFEQMGASVDYDAPTKTIQAKKGSDNVSLVLGSPTAFVNGQPQTLLQPAAVIDGTTLVPLRFVAQAFGGYVQWISASQTVQIKTPEEHLSTLPPPPPPSPADQGQVLGALTGVYTNTVPPQITLRVNGQNTAIPITDATIVLIQQGDQPATQQSVADLKTDRQVRVTRNADGTAQIIQAVYGEVVGTIKSIAPQPDGSFLVGLTDGTSVQVLRAAPVTMGGRHLSLRDVKPAERVVIRTDEENRHGLGVAVVTADDPNPVPPSLPTPPGPVIAPRPTIPPAAKPMPMPAPGPVKPSPFPAPTVTPGGFAPGGAGSPRMRLASVESPVSAAPLPGVTQGVTVQSFLTNVTGPLRGNEIIHVTLRGTPGGKAFYSIPNLSESIGLHETHPGVYEADYKAPSNANITGAAVVGLLAMRDGSSSPAIPAAQQVTIDNTPPIIAVLNPPANATLATPRPEIYALLNDGIGVGVDARSAHLFLDGQDVTAQAILTKASAAYAPAAPLLDGVHAVRLTVSDYLGNTSEKTWNFTVAGARAAGLSLQSDQTGSSIDLDPGQTLGLTLHAPPGGKATYTLGLARQLPFTETMPGVYTALFKSSPGSSVQSAPLVADFRGRDGTETVLNLSQTVSVHANPPRAPGIFFPPDGADVGKTITVAGRSAPNATVDVTISYTSKTLGVFAVNGTAAQQQVTANPKGQWRTVDLPLALASLTSKTQNTTLTVSAVAVDATGQASDPATVKVMQE